MKKIVVVTGARSEYDFLFPLIKRMHQSDNFDVSVLVTGAHLAEKYGKTASFIEKDNFPIADKIYNLVDTDEKIGRVISLGHQIPAFAQTFQRINPDMILVAGDREEALSTTITAAYMSIACGHLFGGDVTKDGNIDNSVRYAASKMAHVHFTAHPKHSETLLKLGEDDWRIHMVGSPAIDRLLETEEITREELSKNLNADISGSPYILVILHPIISEYENEAQNARVTLDALISTGLPCFINSPNSDAGNNAILQVYEEYKAKHPQLHFFKNLDRLTYVNLMRHAAIVVGNSSSGLLEAPTFNLPVVNIGPRQRGRLCSNNVIFVDYDKEEILQAIDKSLNDKEYHAYIASAKNPFGDGKSTDKIINVLENLEIDNKLLYKNITYEW